MPPTSTTPIPTPPTKTGGTIRTLGPAIPVAIALIHAALSPAPPATPPTPASPTTITVSQSQIPACGGGTPDSPPCVAPLPMQQKGHPVDWWFVFKLNASKFPQCGGGDTRTCPFGGTAQKYKGSFGQQYLYASNESPTIQQGSKDCIGTSNADPVGSTFDEAYNGTYHYVIWNDQPYNDPQIQGCSGDGCGAPWGHSKGMLTWNDAGDGFVMQVSTPSWPLSGSVKFPRKSDGNTLGCVKDNDVGVSQHFFALRLNKSDVVSVLKGLNNASVVTDPKNPQIVSNGGPADIQGLVNTLGVRSQSKDFQSLTLSSGVQLISKPSALQVPPWQLVSSILGGISLRTATWWADPQIYTTAADTTIGCWPTTLSKTGPVEIATSGHWNSTTFSLKGGPGTDGNHAKLGVSTSGNNPYAIFGDMNEQGSITGNCDSSQNGRGGLFFVVNNTQLNASLTTLITGDTAPTTAK